MRPFKEHINSTPASLLFDLTTTSLTRTSQYLNKLASTVTSTMRAFTLSLLATTALAAQTKRQAEASLHQLFTARGKEYFGNIADQQLLSDETNAAIITANFGQLTHENSLKWEAVEPEEGSFNFDEPDVLVDFATENGLAIRGHTLVWHSQLPAWVEEITDAETLTAAIENHITEVMGRYKGQMIAWVRLPSS